MRLGGVTVTVQANGGGGVAGTKYIQEFAGMPSAVMAPPRLAPPSSMAPRSHKSVFTSPGLSLAPPSGLESGLTQLGQTPESEQLKKDEEYESRSGSDNMDGGSGDDQDPDQPPNNKKRYHRHSQRQIHEMEMLFKECPHPDDKQRLELSKELGLAPTQVKFWFQNRRTQMKTQQERAENSMLRSENEKLRSENVSMREAMKNSACPHCGGPTLGDLSFEEQQLRMDNARLRDELERVSVVAAKFLGRPPPIPSIGTMSNSSLDLQVGGGFGTQQGGGSELMLGGPSVADVAMRQGGLSDAEKPLVLELASAAMDELICIAQEKEPLWIPGGNGGKELLNYDEYLRLFPRGIGHKPPGLKTEATREAGTVLTNGMNLVETLLDPDRYVEMFPCIVSRAHTLEILNQGDYHSRHNALQMMYAEQQVLSPFVPTREIYFLRYCRQLSNGVWGMVDVSVDSLRQNPPPSLMRCRRRPSGCLIQDLGNGYCRVTVVEHMEYDDRAVNRVYKSVVNSGQAFGANRWLATLQRQCDRLACMESSATHHELAVSTGIPHANGRRAILQLAQRMTHNFCAGVSASTVHTWTTLSSGTGRDDDVRVMTRKSVDNPGEPQGIVLAAATSLWLPVLPKRLFEFLRDDRLRQEWDILSNGGSVLNVAHIAKGQDPGNSVSVIRVNNMLILQESCIDAAGSLVVYAPVDLGPLNLVLTGGDTADVALLPSGFAILPDSSDNRRNLGGVDTSMAGADDPPSSAGASLLTVAFQILVSNQPSAKLTAESVTTVNHLIACTVDLIKQALCSNHECVQ